MRAGEGIRTFDPTLGNSCYAASLGISRSTNRKNRVLRVPELNLRTLRRLERAGLVVRSGPRRHHYIAGVLVRLADQPPAICTTQDNAVIARRES
jgi:hypothetical protein